MNSVKFTAIALLTVLQLATCKQPEKIAVINFDDNVKAAGITKNSKNGLQAINFCKIINVDWDSILIIPPYTMESQIDKIKAENISTIKSEILASSTGDDHLQLIVLKQHKVVAYGELSLVPLNLGRLMNTGAGFVSISKENCAHFIAVPNKLDSSTYTVKIDTLK
ncbi:hypothetical protein [Pedobacter gandavensis]|uniref:hypothetical protein n=1 Tax=Pedobacter gandavensis TaxID=2679963 RepID=UPI00292EC86C|nr:hypothetical protein [Pedobacter gandavensis]